MDDYANHPESLSAVRAHREGAASLWTPRDALIDTLRLIDKGEIKPAALVITYQIRSDDGVGAFNVVSVKDKHQALGLLMASIGLLLRPE